MKKDIIILAAGVGSRLRPLTDEVPKTMVKVNGEAIIERLLTQIDSIEDFYGSVKIVSGYKSQILKFFINDLGLKIKIEFIENSDFLTTNNMYSLFLALSKVESPNGIVIINADCFYDKEIVNKVVKSDGNYIAIDKGIFNEESMKVRIDNQGKVVNMAKTLEENNNVYVSIDIYSFNTYGKEKLFKISSEIINNGDLNSWTEVAIDLFAKEKESNIKCIDVTGKRWMEIDNHEDLKTAEKIFIE